MNEKDKDIGLIQVLLERFNTQRLPIALAFKEKVDSGVLLDEDEHKQIYKVQEDLNHIKSLIERNPEYQDVVAKILTLWLEIIKKDIENQKKAS
jgi:hypothetical protein